MKSNTLQYNRIGATATCSIADAQKDKQTGKRQSTLKYVQYEQANARPLLMACLPLCNAGVLHAEWRIKSLTVAEVM